MRRAKQVLEDSIRNQHRENE